jgi:hypothetical protein
MPPMTNVKGKPIALAAIVRVFAEIIVPDSLLDASPIFL